MPTSYKVKEELLLALSFPFEGDIIECGAGFGTLAIPLARKFPHKLVEAYELSPLPFFYLLALKKLFHLKNLKVKRKDFFAVSFSKFGLVVCYLYPKAMEKLGEKVKKELRTKSVVISNTFAIHQLKPHKVIQVHDLYSTSIFLYTISEK